MSVSNRKKKNTDFELQKKMQRDKDLKKKQMRAGQLPPKHAKGEKHHSLTHEDRAIFQPISRV